MVHRKTKVQKFNRAPAARKALMLGLARSFFLHEKIETTLAKAKAVRPEAEKMLTIAKTNTLANRRRLISKLQDKELVEKLLSDIGPRLGGRSGGYTRIQRSFIRKGDMTQMAILTLVEKKPKEEVTKATEKKTKPAETKKVSEKKEKTVKAKKVDKEVKEVSEEK